MCVCVCVYKTNMLRKRRGIIKKKCFQKIVENKELPRTRQQIENNNKYGKFYFWLF